MIAMRLLLPACAALLAACVAFGARAEEPARLPLAPPWDMVSFTMNSWGRPVTAWNVLPDGSGGWSQTEQRDDGAFGDTVTTWHDLPADPAAQAELVRLLAGLPFPAPSYDDCDNRITDQPYGTLRLTRGSTTVEYSYNAGCLDRDYAAWLNVLRAANAQIASRGQAAPWTRREGSDGTYSYPDQ